VVLNTIFSDSLPLVLEVLEKMEGHAQGSQNVPIMTVLVLELEGQYRVMMKDIELI
jgi:hypothetical protein